MAETMWTSALKNWGAVGQKLTSGSYKMEITNAKPNPKGGGVIFVDLIVLDGPEKDAVVEVTLFVPDFNNRAAGGFFMRKAGGFGMEEIIQNLPNDQQAGMDTMAAALVGRQAMVTLGSGKGDYSDKNEIQSSIALEGSAAPLPVQEDDEDDAEDPGF